ncbi:MAG: hypothetical protein Q4A65_08040 [Bacillota bacterium]|nr:hypothetical protein [Bacillota bacterium]
MFRNKKVLMILSLLIAIGLWIFVMDHVNPQTTISITDINIEMKGTGSLDDIGLKAEIVKPKTVNVTIKGKRSEVNMAKKKGVVAYIDVSTCDYGMNETDIEIDIPRGVSGVTVDSISQETAKFRVK